MPSKHYLAGLLVPVDGGHGIAGDLTAEDDPSADPRDLIAWGQKERRLGCNRELEE